MNHNLKKILFVDDDELLSNVYTSKFKEENFEVWDVKNGKEAWDILQSGKRPDVIISGIMMPIMTGFQLLEKIKASSDLSNIPFYIFSHRGKEEDKKESQRLGALEFIAQSSTTPNEVVRKVKLLLGLKSTFRITISRNIEDGKKFLSFLEKAQEKIISESEIYNIELESQSNDELFKIRLID